jgi:hypothetical protein
MRARTMPHAEARRSGLRTRGEFRLLISPVGRYNKAASTDAISSQSGEHFEERRKTW